MNTRSRKTSLLKSLKKTLSNSSLTKQKKIPRKSIENRNKTEIENKNIYLFFVPRPKSINFANRKQKNLKKKV